QGPRHGPGVSSVGCGRPGTWREARDAVDCWAGIRIRSGAVWAASSSADDHRCASPMDRMSNSWTRRNVTNRNVQGYAVAAEKKKGSRCLCTGSLASRVRRPGRAASGIQAALLAGHQDALARNREGGGAQRDLVALG